MAVIFKDLYQFSSYVPPIDLSFHQYLLLASEPMLVHTGSMQDAQVLLPKLTKALDGRNLSYIFVSHFESDECGGLSLLLKEYPDAKPICSEVTARQLSGFGITNASIVKKPGDKLSSQDYEFEFISYPSEMHLWEGLLLYEKKREIFFSSDLVFRFGNEEGKVVDGIWQEEIDKITPYQVSDPDRRIKLQQELAAYHPAFVAVGHGPCLNLK